MGTPGDTFTVVFLCTGNVFRSAIAEAAFQRATAGLPVHVSSAGTLDLNSAPAHAEALGLAEELEIDLADHRSRCLADVDLTAADLVVGFEREHVVAAVVDGGAGRDEAFTLPELVELLAGVPPSPGDPAAAARRSVQLAARFRVSGWSAAQIPDPIGGSHRVFAATGREVAGLSARLASQLFRDSAEP